MTLWLATGNKGKIAEFERLLAGFDFQIHLQSEINGFSQPPETGKTFLENSQIKARSLAAIKPDDWVLAEDSGLMVDGLNGTPGVHSARYAGEAATDVENNMKVLQMVKIRTPGKRDAKFVSSVVIRSPQKEEFCFEGVVKGKISEGMRGTQGFGYDSVFIPEGHDKTFAELGLIVKNSMSHRAKALAAAIDHLKAQWS